MSLPIPVLQTRPGSVWKIRHLARILVVDDNDFFRDRKETVLNRAGYGTMGAADGEEALALLRTGEFDLVLTACRMPHLDGVGLVRALRATGNRIPVMMVPPSPIAEVELPDDVRGEVAVALPNYADSRQLLAGVARALHSFLTA